MWMGSRQKQGGIRVYLPRRRGQGRVPDHLEGGGVTAKGISTWGLRARNASFLSASQERNAPRIPAGGSCGQASPVLLLACPGPVSMGMHRAVV